MNDVAGALSLYDSYVISYIQTRMRAPLYQVCAPVHGYVTNVDFEKETVTIETPTACIHSLVSPVTGVVTGIIPVNGTLRNGIFSVQRGNAGRLFLRIECMETKREIKLTFFIDAHHKDRHFSITVRLMQNVQQGAIIGCFIGRFKVRVQLPKHSYPFARTGESVRGSQTVLAMAKRKIFFH